MPDVPYTLAHIANGVISGFGAARNLLVAGSGSLVGIDASTCGPGAVLTLTFLSAATIVAMGAPSSGVRIKTERGGESSYQDISVIPDSVVRVELRTDAGPFWKIICGSVA